MSGERLAATRDRLGLTQARAAQLLGTTNTNISRYEHGAATPGDRVTARIRALEELPATSPYTRAPLMTAASTAAAIRRAIKTPGGYEWALQVLAQSLHHLSQLPDDASRTLYLAAPGGTGDRRWNALLARAVAWQCHRLGIPAPAWTETRRLRHAWTPIPYPALRDRIAAATPPELADRNILLDAASLAAA